jgi:hypothetical protein
MKVRRQYRRRGSAPIPPTEFGEQVVKGGRVICRTVARAVACKRPGQLLIRLFGSADAYSDEGELSWLSLHLDQWAAGYS